VKVISANNIGYSLGVFSPGVSGDRTHLSGLPGDPDYSRKVWTGEADQTKKASASSRSVLLRKNWLSV